jgi:uncharacterized protein
VKVEYKDNVAEFKVKTGNVLVGYASVFNNIDSHRDIVRPGAFSKTIKENRARIKVLNQHDTWSPIGKPEVLLEDEKGLYTESVISQTTLGRDILILAADGVLTELSIGYSVIKSADDQTNNVRELLELKLWEYSPVTFASNDLATIAGLKEDADFADVLRKLGHYKEHGLKEGRVLSRANFSRLEGIVKELQDILDAATAAKTQQPTEPLEPDSNTRTGEPLEPDSKHSQTILDALNDLKSTRDTSEPPKTNGSRILESLTDFKLHTAEIALRKELADFGRDMRGMNQ